MPVELNHTIVEARDKRESAEFLAGILGLKTAAQWGPFIPVTMSNGVALDFMDTPDDEISIQHYAFLVSEDEFTASFARIQDAGITYYADPFLQQPGRINHNDGGRGVYFQDPAGHVMELITRPYAGHG
ncbi:VOC family protein [Streptomyces sp. 4N509B]|uniref:VOC family protein n=1 Tax=Streptomyces sp. 4N509B TaxID=3457413 RepID=UPI003FCFA0FC